MMEVSVASNVTEASLATVASDTALLSTDTIPVVTMPLLSTDGSVNGTLGATTPTILNVNVPFLRDGTILGTAGPHGLVIATNPDGTGTVLLDTSQVALLTQSATPTAIYDGAGILGFTTQDVSTFHTATIAESIIPDVATSEVIHTDTSVIIEPPTITSTPIPLSNEDIQPPVRKGPYKCDLCDKEYLKWGQLQRHIRFHAEDKPHRCDQCDASFNLESNLILHKATHCTSDPVCPECGKKFARVASLKAHVMLHEKEENLICTECGDEFTTQMHLDRHMKEHREEIIDERYYNCKQCPKKFSKASLLREHMKIHYKIRASLSHRTYKRNIDRSSFSHKCDTCGKLFQKPSQLVRHNRIHTGERPFKCKVCDKAFNQKGALQIHMTKHSGERPHRCDFCPAAFSQRGNLRAHIQRVHTLADEGNQSLYQCEECTCVFRKLGSLNAHMSRMHTGEIQETDKEDEGDTQDSMDTTQPENKNMKEVISQLIELSKQAHDNEETQHQIQEIAENDKVSADILQQALQNSGLAPSDNTDTNQKQKDNSGKKGVSPKAMVMTFADATTGTLNRHTIRKVGGVRWHQCMYCSKEFKKPSDLVRHIRIHTHEKPYKCSQCFRAFAVKSTLTAHFRTHTGIKEFRCETCSKLFSTQGSLKVHLRLHTGAKPFSCTDCNKKFRTSGHRKSHMLSHSKEGGQRKPKRTQKSQNKADVSLDDIPLQEPILITDSGLLQPAPSKYNCLYNQYIDEENGVNRPYKCNHCSRAFKRSSHLKQHIRSHTGEKPYKCFQCSNSFVTNGALKAHIRIHSGIKAYKCSVCENTFTTKGSLKRHMCIHSEMRPYMCPYCQKTFKTSMNCKKHMKTHRHELVLHNAPSVTVTVVPDISSVSHTNAEVSENATVETAATQDLAGQIIDNLTSINVDDVHQREQTDATQVTVSSLAPPPLAQGGTLTTQTFQSQEALTQENLQQLQQSLNQQVFDTQQHLTPAELEQAGLAQPALHPQTASFDQAQTNFFSHTLTQLSNTGFSQNQFTLQGDGLDVGTLAGTFATSASALIAEPLVTTTMASILQTQENNADGATNQEQTLLSLQNATIAADSLEDKLPEEGHEDGKVGRRSFKCSYCSKTFKKSSHLKQHIRTHTGEKPFKCMQCTRMFVSMGVLRAHARTHTGVRDFRCNMCGAEFTTNGSLTRHMMIHSSVRPFHCSYCSETFRTSMMHRRHLKVHRDNTQTTNANASGDESGGMLLSEQVRMSLKKGRIPVVLLSDEQAEELAKQNPDDTASVSERVLIASAAEKNRISEIKDRTAEIEKLPKFANQCDHCPKSFKKPSDLVRHIRIHTGEKPFCCEICSKSFTVKSTLDSHQKIHTGEKNFSCHVCNSLFATKGSLKVHMRLHTGAKPFKCPHCDLRFRTSGHRKSHIGTHFKETSRKRKHPDTSLEQEVSSNLLPSDLPHSSTQTGCLSNITIPAEALNSLAAAGVTPSQVVQGIESIQLQLSPSLLGQSIQITGLDPALLSKTVHIDSASLSQQLQQQLNINITISPNLLSETLGGSASVTPAVATSTDSTLLPASLGTDAASAPSGTITLNPIIIHQLGIPLNSQQHILNENEVHDADTGIIEGEASFDVTNDNQHKEHEIITTDQHSTNDAIADTVVGGSTLATEECIVRDDLGLGTENIGVDIEENTVTIVENTISISENNDIMQNMHLLNISSTEDSVSGGTLERMYICQVCSKTFKKLNHFKVHSLTHTQTNKNFTTSHPCFHCEKVFFKKSQLDRHVRIHTGEKPFVCTECNKAFNQKNALQIHLKKHTGDKPYNCPHCSMDFSQKGNLSIHIKRAHLNNSNINNNGGSSLQEIILKNS